MAQATAEVLLQDAANDLIDITRSLQQEYEGILDKEVRASAASCACHHHHDPHCYCRRYFWISLLSMLVVTIVAIVIIVSVVSALWSQAGSLHS